MTPTRAESRPGPEPEPAEQLWGRWWMRYVFPSLWLVYLAQPAGGVHKHAHGTVAVLGYVIIGVFAATYLIALPLGRAGAKRGYWVLYGVCLALTAVECAIAHGDGFVFGVYLGVLTIAARRRWALAGVVTLALAALVVPKIAWNEGLGWGNALVIALVAFAMVGFFGVLQANRALTEARAEVARLAAENERSRIARDLHDLLGHSLTTITVKAGLARRLGEHGDTDRALVEIGEVEQLARRTLGDVRAAVAGHREVTLAGELATAREVLRAAGVVAELPGSVDGVDPELSELFGWVLREGVTNVVRHARAAHVRVGLGTRTLEILDDGNGGSPVPGSGLCGLRERVDAAGGTLTASGGLNGFRLRVDVPAPAKIGERV